MAFERHTGGAAGASCRARRPSRSSAHGSPHTGRVSPALADERLAAFFADVAEGRSAPRRLRR